MPDIAEPLSESAEPSPDQTVAKAIVEKFREQSLLDVRHLNSRHLGDLVERLAAGTLTEEDWKLYAELTEDTVRESTPSDDH